MSSVWDKARSNLLCLPQSDLVGHGNNKINNNNNSYNQSNAVQVSRLMLLQLPPGWTVHDMKNAHFVAHPDTNSAASLVVESRNASFDLFKVETSNALVLVPSSTTDIADSTSEATMHTVKRVKRNHNGNIKLSHHLSLTPARLLREGGSGASFLELRSRPLVLMDLQTLLAPTLWDPTSFGYRYSNATVNNNNNCNNSNSNNNNNSNPMPSLLSSWTIVDMAHQLRVSQHQIKLGLAQIENAFAIPSTAIASTKDDDDGIVERYCLLADSLMGEVYDAILATLLEQDDYQDYATTGFAVDLFIQTVVNNTMDSGEQLFDHAPAIVRHCLFRLAPCCSDDYLLHSSTQLLQLDVNKVARCVARRIFQRHDTLIMQHEALWAQWQSEMPGIGPLYAPHEDQMHGLALRVDIATDDHHDHNQRRQHYWRYLPAQELLVTADGSLSNVADAWKALFQVKAAWTKEELQPYVDYLAQATGQHPADLILQYATMTTETCQGDTIQLYRKR